MLESYLNPNSARISKAQSDCFRIENSGSPIATHWLSGEVLQQVLGVFGVSAELFRRKPRDEEMVVTVRGDFVAQAGDPADNLGELRGQSAHHKKGGLGVVLIQKTKQDVELTENVAGRRWQAPPPLNLRELSWCQSSRSMARIFVMVLSSCSYLAATFPGWHRNHTSAAG